MTSGPITINKIIYCIGWRRQIGSYIKAITFFIATFFVLYISPNTQSIMLTIINNNLFVYTNHLHTYTTNHCSK